MRKGLLVMVLLVGMLLLFGGCRQVKPAEEPKQTPGEASEVIQGTAAVLPEIVIKEAKEAEAPRDYTPSGASNEAAPSFFELNGKRYVITVTGHSVLVPLLDGMSILDMFTKEPVFDEEAARWITHGQIETKDGFASSSKLNQQAEWQTGATYWKRNYYGIYSSQIVEVGGKQYFLGVTHGENKNEKFRTGKRYTNTVQPKRSYADNEYSGVGSNGVYDDYPETYFAFTGMVCVPADRIHEKAFDDPEFDYGPVVWPSNGYLDINGGRVNTGLRHPSLFIDGEYMYLYYLDNNALNLARAKITSLGKPGSFMKCFNGEFEEPALPTGFDKSSRSFFKRAGGMADNILPGSTPLRFSVAKLEGTPYYLGVEEYFTFWPHIGIRLRLSKDLIHWSSGTELPGATVDDYNDGTTHYPVFVNKEGTSMSRVEPEGFYIMGTYGNNIGRGRPEIRYISIELKEN